MTIDGDGVEPFVFRHRLFDRLCLADGKYANSRIVDGDVGFFPKSDGFRAAADFVNNNGGLGEGFDVHLQHRSRPIYPRGKLVRLGIAPEFLGQFHCPGAYSQSLVSSQAHVKNTTT